MSVNLQKNHLSVHSFSSQEKTYNMDELVHFVFTHILDFAILTRRQISELLTVVNLSNFCVIVLYQQTQQALDCLV